jgi:hypothetical protein
MRRQEERSPPSERKFVRPQLERPGDQNRVTENIDPSILAALSDQLVTDL